MKVQTLELFHLRLPLIHPFETSFGRVTHTETLIVKAVADGVTGYGECPASAAPLYSYETVHTARHVIKDFLAPKLAQIEMAMPTELGRHFTFVRGHNMAKAGIEMALWDIAARQRGVPLYKLLGGERDRIPTGISLGIEKTPAELMEGVERALARGYQRIKIKIKPGWDVDIVREVANHFPGIKLMVDANGAYTLRDADHLKKLDEFNLMMIEQPLDYDDYVEHSLLQRYLRTPICLDECLRSPADARKAIYLGSAWIFNIKQARLGGTTNAIELHDIAQAENCAVWCGGLLESGIGRAHNVALSSLPNFTLPGDVSPSEKYYREEIVDPPIVMDEKGVIVISSRPGMGHEVRHDVMDRFTVGRERVL